MKLASALLACALLSSASLAAAEVPPQKTVLESARGEFWTVGDETFFVFESSPARRVTLTGTNLRIVCDHLEMTAVGIGDKDATLPTLEKFKYLLATGNVQIVQGDREATCGRAEVFPREDKVVLTENPVVIDHGNDTRATGARITMLRGEQRVRIEDSLIEGPPIRDLGFEREPPPPAQDSSAPPAAAPAPQQ